MPPKRKSNATLTANAVKKSRIQRYSHCERDDDEVIRASLVNLAQYAHSLEEELNSLSNKATAANPSKTPEQLQVAVENLRKAALSGIKKQMATGSAKWSYDSVCADPAVFSAMMGLEGPPAFKMKKFPKDEFERLVGDVTVSKMYDNLYITSSDVIVRWSDSGEFKFSGSYGRMR